MSLPVSDSPEDLRRWRLPRGRHGLPRELVERSQRERLLAAVVKVTVAKGYESTTVGDILGEAGVGRESFYELFDDKLACMLASHKILVDELEQRVREAYLGGRPLGGADAACASRRRSTGSRPIPTPPASCWSSSAPSGPPSGRPSRPSSRGRSPCWKRAGGEDGPEPDLAQAYSLAAGTILARIYEEIVLGRTAELPRLLPDLTYELLVPFVGEERARAAADA